MGNSRFDFNGIRREGIVGEVGFEFDFDVRAAFWILSGYVCVKPNHSVTLLMKLP
jgi:hypothetical protein